VSENGLENGVGETGNHPFTSAIFTLLSNVQINQIYLRPEIYASVFLIHGNEEADVILLSKCL